MRYHKYITSFRDTDNNEPTGLLRLSWFQIKHLYILSSNKIAGHLPVYRKVPCLCFTSSSGVHHTYLYYIKWLQTAIVRINTRFKPIAHWVRFFVMSILEWNPSLVINLWTHWNIYSGEIFDIVGSFTAKLAEQSNLYGEKRGTQTQCSVAQPLN